MGLLFQLAATVGAVPRRSALAQIPAFEASSRQLADMPLFVTNLGMERCVQCNSETDVPFNRPISARRRYEPGIGQYCAKCWGRY